MIACEASSKKQKTANASEKVVNIHITYLTIKKLDIFIFLQGHEKRKLLGRVVKEKKQEVFSNQNNFIFSWGHKKSDLSPLKN